MKMRRVTILSILAVLLLTAVMIVPIETRENHGWCRRHQLGPASYLAHELNLSDAQKSQIQAIWKSQSPAFSAQLRELLAENKEIEAIVASSNPNQAEIQKVAAREATTVTTLLTQKACLELNIESTVLNPGQREKARELRKKWESRLDRLADRIGEQPATK